jgi:CBS domain containing-hemolysin-like protein
LFCAGWDFPRKEHSQRAIRGRIAPRAFGGAKRGGRHGGGRNLILNALDLRHRTAREVMRPRHEVTVFNTAATMAECLALAEKSRYSRFPICDDGDLDKTRGVVHIKDLYALRDKAQTAADLLPRRGN